MSIYYRFHASSDSGLVLDIFLDVFGNRLLSLHLNYLEMVAEKARGTG